MSAPAPILIFAYKRPAALTECLAALAQCPEAKDSTVFVYCDGARDVGDRSLVRETQQVAHRATGFGRVHIQSRDQNLGLKQSVIDGVSDVTANLGAAIVLEDDLLVSKGFLRWMNDGLDKYRNEPQVAAVAGHSFLQRPATSPGFFLPAITTWGWATWERSWSLFDACPDVSALSNSDIQRAFDLRDSYPYTLMMLRQQIGALDTWGVLWWWAVFRHGLISLFPPRTLVCNLGFGSSASNTRRGPRSVRRANEGWSADAGAPAFPQQLEVLNDDFSDWSASLRPNLVERWARHAVLMRLQRKSGW